MNASASSPFHLRAFTKFWFARVATTMAYQMLAVGLGWQIYALTGSALDLGLVGLVQFLPAVLLGGVGTLFVVLLWMRLFPTLLRRDRLRSTA